MNGGSTRHSASTGGQTHAICTPEWDNNVAMATVKIEHGCIYTFDENRDI